MHIRFLNIFNKLDSNFASIKSITFEHFYNDCFLENVAEQAPPHHTFRRKTHSGQFMALTITSVVFTSSYFTLGKLQLDVGCSWFDL